MQFLIDIVEACDRNNIELKLFVEPTHAIMQQWVKRSGNLPAVERWKRALVLIVTKFAPNNDGSIVLWDFSGFNSINTEKIPDNPQQTMRWYIDPVHYTKETGDLMIEKIFNNSSASQGVPQDFGVIINEQNIDAHLKSLRTVRE
jgi:hypothetical protein